MSSQPINIELAMLAQICRVYGHQSAYKYMRHLADRYRTVQMHLEPEQLARLMNLLAVPCAVYDANYRGVPYQLQQDSRKGHIVLALMEPNRYIGQQYYALMDCTDDGQLLMATFANVEQLTIEMDPKLDDITGTFVLFRERTKPGIDHLLEVNHRKDRP